MKYDEASNVYITQLLLSNPLMIYKHQQKSRRLMIYVAHQQYRRQVNFVNISKTAIVRLDENSHGPS
jgi:hypothetical protein